MSGSDIHTVRDARRLLQVAPTASPDEVRQAFRAAVRIAHPDRGGDADTLRRVVDAYRLLGEAEVSRVNLAPATVPGARPAAIPALEITIRQALCGGEASVTLPGGRHGVARVPAGLRAGDVVRLNTAAGPALFKVRFARGGMDVRGDNLWMMVRAPADLLREGGRLEVETPAGRRTVQVTPEAGRRGLVRIPYAGLPARGPHAQGHLFLRLEAEARPAQTNARSLLRRFTAAWAA